MSFRIVLRPAAKRALKQVDCAHRTRIQGAIAMLAQDPRPPSAIRLKNRDEFRVRVGDDRILYQVIDQELLIIDVTLGHRRSVYSAK